MHWIRYTVLGLLLAACGFMLFHAYNFIEKHHQPKYYPVNYIPQNALFVYTGSNIHEEYNKLNGGAVWFEELKSAAIFNSLMKVLTEVDSISVDEPLIQEAFNNSEFAFGIIPQGDELRFLFCLNDTKEEGFFEAWQRTHPQLRKQSFNGHEALKSESYLMVKSDRVIFVTQNDWEMKLLLEEQKSGAHNWENSYKLTDKRESLSGNFLFNFERLSEYLKKQTGIQIPKLIAKNLGINGSDFYYNSNQLFWSGLSDVEVENDVLNLPFEIHRAIPHNADLVVRYAHNKLNDYDSCKTFFQSNTNWNEYDKEYGADFDYHLMQWLGNECAKVEIELENKQKKYLVLSINPQELSPEEHLGELKRKINEYYNDVDSSESMRLPIGWEGIFGDDFKMEEKVYFGRYEGYLIVANSKGDLDAYLQECRYRSLYEDPNFGLMLSNSMAQNSWGILYVNPKYARESLAKILDEPLENLSWINSFPKFIIQLCVSKENNFTNMSLAYQSEALEKNTSKLWELNLGSKALYGPELVKNHRTNSQDILVQTEDHILHLISPNGTKKWSYQLNSEIIGEVLQVDGFANNKYQFLLQTKDKLHAIDILGREMGGFPINLNEPSPSLTAIRYNPGSDLRIFFESSGKLRNYDIQGKSVKGWIEPEIKRMKLAVQHFVIGGKDHLMCLDGSNAIHMFNRKGERHPNSDLIKPQIKSTIKTPVYFEKSSNLETYRLSYLDSNGIWHKRYLGGLQDSVQFVNSSKSSTLLIGDINGDNAPEIFLTGKGKLNVYWSKDDLNYSYSYEGNNAKINSHFVSGEYLVTICTETENIVLNEGGGALGRMSKIPLGPFTLSDLNQAGQVVKLVVDSQGILSAHKIRG